MSSFRRKVLAVKIFNTYDYQVVKADIVSSAEVESWRQFRDLNCEFSYILLDKNIL